jgi:two-component system, OmpR family, sensor kinase
MPHRSRGWPRRAISDRRKVMSFVVALTIATISIVGYITVHATRHRLIDRTDSALQNQLATAKVAVDLLTPEALASLERLDRVSARESAVIVLDGTGRVVSTLPIVSEGKNDVQPVLPPVGELRRRVGHPFDARASDGTRYRVATGELGASHTIVFATPLTAVDQTVHDLADTTIAIGGLATALLSLLLWFLLTAATKPIDSMIDVATKIGDGDFSARIDPDDMRGDAERLGTALNQMVSRLEEAFAARTASDERLRQFVADASHELRTPLTSIRGYAQLCRIGAAGPDTEIAVQRIESEARRMSSLVDDLLLLARLDQGRQGPSGDVDVVDLVSELAADARVIEPGRPMSLDIPTEPVTVFGNAEELHQVFANLLANVRAHTDPGVPSRVAIETTLSTVTITVADQGPGMAEADAASAFDRFFRSDVSRSRLSGGSGLGLSIAKTLVEAHGGTIDLETGLDAGTTVSVVLPRAEPAPVTLCQNPTTPSVTVGGL